MNKGLLLMVFLLSLTACSIPVMKLDHIGALDERYPMKGALVVQGFEDKRPVEEKTGGTVTTVFAKDIWSGITEPDAATYVKEAIKKEAERTGFFLTSSTGEFVLSGAISSLKVEKSYGGLVIIPLFRTDVNEATVKLHVVLRKNGVPVLEKDFDGSAQDTYWAMLDFTMSGMSEKSEKVLDQALTAVIKKVFDAIKADVAFQRNIRSGWMG